MHPDGLFLALGSENGTINFYDLTTTEQVMIFDTSIDNNNTSYKGIKNISFSENGYLMTCLNVSTSCSYMYSNHFNVLDLRKTENMISKYEATHKNDKLISSEYIIRKMQYDSSGTFLIMCGSDIRLYNHKTSKNVQSNEFFTIDSEDYLSFEIDFNTNVILAINPYYLCLFELSNN